MSSIYGGNLNVQPGFFAKRSRSCMADALLCGRLPQKGMSSSAEQEPETTWRNTRGRRIPPIEIGTIDGADSFVLGNFRQWPDIASVEELTPERMAQALRCAWATRRERWGRSAPS